MRWGVVACMVLATGCFEPGLPGDLRCSDGLCPAGSVCDNGVCRSMLTPDGAPDGSAADAAVDAPTCLTLSFQDGDGDYDGTQDTRLLQGTPNMPLGSIPEAEWDDDSGGGGGLSVALIRFDDLFGEAAVPLDATIEEATLRVVIVNDSVEPAGSVHETRVAWDETTTFSTFGPDPGVDGEDHGPKIAEAPNEAGERDIDLTGSVRRAQSAAGDEEFSGWVFLPASGNPDGAAFATSESIEPHPRLTVRFCR